METKEIAKELGIEEELRVRFSELYEQLWKAYYPDGMNYVWEMEAIIKMTLTQLYQG